MQGQSWPTARSRAVFAVGFGRLVCTLGAGVLPFGTLWGVKQTSEGRRCGIASPMSAFAGKADAVAHPSECLLIAISGHSTTVHSDLRQPNLLPFSPSSRCYPGNLGLYEKSTGIPLILL